jgi:hypothetical protein
METYTYKVFTIKEIYQSADGRGNYDYFISSESNPQVYVKIKTTLTKIKLFIDANEEMLNTPKY